MMTREPQAVSIKTVSGSDINQSKFINYGIESKSHRYSESGVPEGDG